MRGRRRGPGRRLRMYRSRPHVHAADVPGVRGDRALVTPGEVAARHPGWLIGRTGGAGLRLLDRPARRRHPHRLDAEALDGRLTAADRFWNPPPPGLTRRALARRVLRRVLDAIAGPEDPPVSPGPGRRCFEASLTTARLPRARELRSRRDSPGPADSDAKAPGTRTHTRVPGAFRCPGGAQPRCRSRARSFRPGAGPSARPAHHAATPGRDLPRPSAPRRPSGSPRRSAVSRSWPWPGSHRGPAGSTATRW